MCNAESKFGVAALPGDSMRKSRISVPKVPLRFHRPSEQNGKHMFWRPPSPHRILANILRDFAEEEVVMSGILKKLGPGTIIII